MTDKCVCRLYAIKLQLVMGPHGLVVVHVRLILNSETNPNIQLTHSKKRCVNFCPNFNTPFGVFYYTPFGVFGNTP